MLDVTIIGTGALQPLPGRALAAAAVTCKGNTVLFDCGEGTQSAARSAGLSLYRIDCIALTHYHGDHIFGLPGLLQSMGIAGREKALWLTGPGDIEEELRPLLSFCRELPFPLRYFPQEQDEYPLHDFLPDWPQEAVLRPFPTCHRVPSRGYVFSLRRRGKFLPEAAEALRVPVTLWKKLQSGEDVTFDGRTVTSSQVMGPERQGLTVVYTGDTLPCDGIAQAACRPDLLICEGTYADESLADMAREHGHMTFMQAAGMARQAGAQRLVLTHFSPRTEEPESYLGPVREVFPAAECGTDGMQIRLAFKEETQA